MKPIAINLLQRSDVSINAPNANDTICLEHLLLEGLYEDFALEVIGRWDVPYNWWLRALRQLQDTVGRARPNSDFISLSIELFAVEVGRGPDPDHGPAYALAKSWGSKKFNCILHATYMYYTVAPISMRTIINFVAKCRTAR